jgi:hypothetical protein
VSDPTNRKQFYWAEEWRKVRDEREAKEDEWAAPDPQGERVPFEGKPWFYAWCEYKSRRLSGTRAGGEIRRYVLADEYHRGVECSDYNRPVDPEPEPSQPALDPAPAVPRWSWRTGGSF